MKTGHMIKRMTAVFFILTEIITAGERESSTVETSEKAIKNIGSTGPCRLLPVQF